MTETDVLTLLRDGLGIAMMMALPLLLAALLTGLAVGLLQALTSIQEMTLTFVPKLGVMMIVFWATASLLGRLIVGFFEKNVLSIVAGG